MDGISLTRIARAAVLPAMIGISAADPARGDDPVAVRRRPRLHSPGCNDPGPAIVRRHPKSHELQRQARRDRPRFFPPIGDRRPADPSADRHGIRPHSAIFLVAKAGGAHGPGGEDRGWQTSPMGGATVRRSSGGAPAARRPAGDAAVRRTQAGAAGPDGRPRCRRRPRCQPIAPAGDAAGGQRRRARRASRSPSSSPSTAH